eukprot:6182807-Pleurochrysis_carterae.AAC.5
MRHVRAGSCGEVSALAGGGGAMPTRGRGRQGRLHRSCPQWCLVNVSEAAIISCVAVETDILISFLVA